MKNIFKLSCLILVMVLFNRCKDEEEISKLHVVEFPRTFSSSVNSVVLTAQNDSVAVVQFAWQAVSYGIVGPVTYSLQFTVPSDTIGTTPWANAHEIIVGNDLLTKSLMGYELNRIAINELSLSPGLDAPIVVRARSFLNRPAYSNAIVLDVTPFDSEQVILPRFDLLWVPGDYQGWLPATARNLASILIDSVYEGYVYFPEGSGLEFKYTAQADWRPIAYGSGGDTILSEAIYPQDYSILNRLSVPSPGYYFLTANLNNLSWTATRTTWSVIGDATLGGWTTDTQMSFDPATQVWSVTLNMRTAGSFKFRANNSWALNFGIDAEGNLAYSDNPLYPWNPLPQNITVPSDGNYTITLDLRVPGNYTFTLRRN